MKKILSEMSWNPIPLEQLTKSCDCRMVSADGHVACVEANVDPHPTAMLTTRQLTITANPVAKNHEQVGLCQPLEPAIPA
ncbi:MAG: hypothetical protein GXP28_06220 [Planctomycetes bacterium]|nr:hypothetical protein [Planctomycetota bacterium]